MSTRQEKLKELLKEEMSEILAREFKDPRLGFITVIGAEITPDMRYARVFVSVMGNDEEKERNMAILNKGAHFARAALGKRIKIKILPEIEFKLDTSVDQGIRIFELLQQIKHDEQEEGT